MQDSWHQCKNIAEPHERRPDKMRQKTLKRSAVLRRLRDSKILESDIVVSEDIELMGLIEMSKKGKVAR